MTSPRGRWSNPALSSAIRCSIAAGETSVIVLALGSLLNCVAPRSQGMMTSRASDPPGYQEKARARPGGPPHRALERGGWGRRQRLWGEAEVAGAEGAETAIEPGLL